MGRGATTNSIPEIENARFILVIGSNTTEAHPVLALRMKKAARNGATLVVADPRKIWLTKLAKRHLQLRPGSDVWLVNAMMHVILKEGLQNEEYIREHTEDFDAVAEVVSRYTPQEAEKVTGVPAADIVATAREYATEKHAAIFYTLGITEHACAVDNIWSLSNLVLMTGHLGYESTGLNALRGQNNVQGLNDAGANPSYFPGYQPADEAEIRQKFSEAWGVQVPETPGYRLDQIMSGLHDGRIKALYLIGENPAQTEPNAHHVEEGLEHLDFLITQDLFLNDMTERLADVVFPASSFAEKDGTFTNTERRVNRVRKAVPCPGEAREDWQIVVDMAKALGGSWPEYRTPEDVWNEFADLSPLWTGIRYDRIEEVGLQWPCTDREHPGTPFLHSPSPSRPSGKGKFYPVENHLDHSLVLAQGNGFAVAHERKSADADVQLLLLCRLFGEADRGDLRRAIGAARDQAFVHRMGIQALDRFDADDAFVLCLVRKEWRSGNIADGVDARHIGAVERVHHDGATFSFSPTFSRPRILDVADNAYGGDNALNGERLRPTLASSMVAVTLSGLLLQSGDLGIGQDFDALLLELLAGKRRNLCILRR